MTDVPQPLKHGCAQALQPKLEPVSKLLFEYSLLAPLQSDSNPAKKAGEEIDPYLRLHILVVPSTRLGTLPNDLAEAPVECLVGMGWVGEFSFVRPLRCSAIVLGLGVLVASETALSRTNGRTVALLDALAGTVADGQGHPYLLAFL